MPGISSSSGVSTLGVFWLLECVSWGGGYDLDRVVSMPLRFPAFP